MDWGALGLLFSLATLQPTSGDVKQQLQSSVFVHENPADIIPELNKYPHNEYPINTPTKVYEETAKENGQEGKNVINSVLDQIRNGAVFKTVKSIVPYGLQSDGLNGIIDFRNILANDGKHIIKPREIVVQDNMTDYEPVKNESTSSNDDEKPNDALPNKNNETITISDIIVPKSNLSYQRQLNPEPNHLEIQNKKALQEILQFGEPLFFQPHEFKVLLYDKIIERLIKLRDQNESSQSSFPRFRIIPGIRKPKAKNVFTYKESKENRNAVFDESATHDGDSSEIPENNETIKPIVNNFENSNGTSEDTKFDDTETQVSNERNFHEAREKFIKILDYLLDIFVDKKVENKNKNINIAFKFKIYYDSNNLNKTLEIKDVHNANEDYDEDDLNPNQNARRRNDGTEESYNESINTKSLEKQDRANSNKTNILNNKQNNKNQSDIKNIMNSTVKGKNYHRDTNKVDLKVNKQNKSEEYLNKSKDTVINAKSENGDSSKWNGSLPDATSNTYEQNTNTKKEIESSEIIPEPVENSKKMTEKTNKTVFIRTLLYNPYLAITVYLK